MIGHNKLGAGAYTSAIVQKAEKDWRFYESALIKMDTDKGLMLQEYKEGEAWKKHYTSWEDACVPLDISKRQADRLIEQHKVKSGTECPTSSDKKESAALKQVEKAREPKPAEPEPDKEEDEKPAVHSADEPATSGHAKPKENGKPKSRLAIWSELEQTLFGRAINRIDELNRQCPNITLHAQLIAKAKACLDLLEQWKAAVK
jgi:hypothetical protein